MEKLFRYLRADEIDCRIGTLKEKGLTLLLYKDARCDMNILDETFGAFGWQRHHSRENANCIVSVYDERKGEWIEKEDTGTESNTEAEKGLASDSFKRACFNWGIGRELYTAPFIWIPKEMCNYENKNGKLMCFDKFCVTEIGYDIFGTINKLVISNVSKGNDVFVFPKETPFIARTPEPQKTPEPQEERVVCADCGCEIKDTKAKDGKPLALKDYVAMCMKFYGRPVCNNCRNPHGKAT